MKPSPGILVVDDRPDLRALLQTVLRNAGFDVWLTPGSAPAAELYGRHHERISVALVAAASSDPVGTLSSLQAINPSLLCCILADSASGLLEEELIAAGAVRVIRPPFDGAALIRLLWSLIGPDDRRSRPRSPRQATRVAVASGIAPAPAVISRLRDQSPDGLRLDAPERLGEVGAILSVRPFNADPAEPWVPVQVRHARPEGERWSLGCRYVQPETGTDEAAE